MVGREKVIKGLEETEIMLTQAVDRGGEMAVMGAFKCLNHVTNAIALLKDQPEIVRCEDCIFRDARDGMCEHVLQVRDPDWYCADGERRDDDG